MRPYWALLGALTINVLGALPDNETYRGVAEERKPAWRVPKYGAQPGPDYMVDNTNNYYGVAPDKGRLRINPPGLSGFLTARCRIQERPRVGRVWQLRGLHGRLSRRSARYPGCRGQPHLHRF